jgi:ABC-2 type transport system ATP-binding protein
MGAPIIETEGLTKRFQSKTAVENLGVTVNPGEAVALLGPNGAGKTTTVRILTCLIEPTEGSAKVLGKDISIEKNRQYIRARVGLLTESPGLYDRASAWYNLLYFARLYQLEHPERAVERYLQELELWDRRFERTASFSKGMKQRLAIARALLHEPDLIFLDEPTSGLDPAASRKLREFLLRLKEKGRTILLTTHNLAEAERVADRIVVMKKDLIAVDTPDALHRRLFGHRTRFVVENVSGATLASIRSLPFVKDVFYADSELLVTQEEPEKGNPILISTLVGAGASVKWVTDERASLEDIYLELVDQTESGFSEE